MKRHSNVSVVVVLEITLCDYCGRLLKIRCNTWSLELRFTVFLLNEDKFSIRMKIN